MSLVLLQTTTTEENAEVLIACGLQSGLVSCVQKMAIESCYFWENELKRDKEILLTFKVNQSDFKKLESEILKKHVYEIPEIVRIGLDYVLEEYEKWHNGVIKAQK